MNIAMILEMAADALGDRIAIGTKADGLSYAQLRAAARGIAHRVDEEHGHVETLALIEPLSPVVPAALFGAAWAGVSYAPLNYRLPDPQLRELLHRLEPVVVVGPTLGRPGFRPRIRVRPRPRAPRGAALHERYVGRTQGRAPAPRPAPRLHLQHPRVRLGRRGRGGDRVGAAVPHRGGRRGVELRLHRSPRRATPPLHRGGVDRHRPRRGRHPRHASCPRCWPASCR